MSQAAQQKFISWRAVHSKKTLSACVCVLLLVSMFSGAAIAQEQTSHSSTPESSPPDAPMPQNDGPVQNGEAVSAQGGATVSGTVLDSTGALIQGARVNLARRDGSQLQTAKSKENGQFAFLRVPPGSYLVKVEAPGFAVFTSQEFSVSGQQVYVVPGIALLVAGSTTSVTVRPTEEIAAEQVKQEEQQRFFGVFPNFYVSYVPDPAPLTSKQKLSLVAHDTFDWSSFVGVSLGAGLQQATNAHSGYGQGAAGYGKRWGALFVDGRSSDLLSRYVFSSILHQDPRYFYQGTGTKKSRFYHAISNAFVARSDSGERMPNYSYLLGDLCSAALSNAYYPPADRGASLVFTTAAFGIAGRATQGLFQEFLAKRLTKHVPEQETK